VKTTKRASLRMGVVVLDKLLADISFCIFFRMKGFKKKSSAVFKNLGFDEKNSGE
jgi:hypothetical protein